MTTQITLTFDVPDSEVHKLIPCVALWAEIHTVEGITAITDVNSDKASDKDCTGYNARLYARTLKE